jgi:nucleoid-associated protein YgaU
VSGAANVVIDTISYDAEGEVLLAGRAVPDALVRLYLNNDLVETAEVSPEGLWEARVAGIAQGVYTLRADEVTPDGKVISRFETPFERALRADAVLAAEAAAEAAEAETAAATVAEVPPGQTAAPGEVPVLEAAPGALAVAGVVTVQPGFTLWQIARENYGDGFQYVRVFQSNRDRIRDPDLIYPGQVFAVPRETP